jgi:hypothetical protein
MADRPRFLLGYGERLTEPLEPITGGAQKRDAYSIQAAQSRLIPKIQATVRILDDLPQAACPNDEAVAVITVHPEYIAKSYYPGNILLATHLEAIGSRPTKVKPDGWAKKREPKLTPSTDLFVAGKRTDFRAWANSLPTWTEISRGADELPRIEEFRAFTPKERIKSRGRVPEEALLEVVLHTPKAQHSDYILDSFRAYVLTFDARLDIDRRIYVGGLCFLPLRAHKRALTDIAKFSFLRAVRPMPKLRPLSPITRSWPRQKPYPVLLPAGGAIDPMLRAAVFDGGLRTLPALQPWVEAHDAPGTAKAHDDYLDHGTAVTSALLFGSLERGKPPGRPFGRVDHYRVLDDKSDTDEDLYDVLHRIRNILQTRSYPFINLSIGPALPVDDDDVHAWTATLDEFLSSGETLAAVAVGNGGADGDPTLGFNRVQVPSDSVNALAVGATDSPTDPWTRADYSSVGPGRSPGVVKPDVVAFGGSSKHPFWILDAHDTSKTDMTAGTSFAAPSVLRMGMGIRAHFGALLNPLAIRALLIHSTEAGTDRVQTGWGRVPDDLEDYVTCPDGTARVVYQGELAAAQYVRAQIPLPTAQLTGMVTIRATLCYATAIDPEDPGNYTRSGLDIAFRPHDRKFRKAKPGQRESLHPATAAFFQLHDYSTEEELRRDAHKWETVLHRERGFRGPSLRNPVFDIHYNARSSGRRDPRHDKLRYALVLTVTSPRTSDLYDQVVTRYRTLLEPLVPLIQIPIRP